MLKTVHKCGPIAILDSYTYMAYKAEMDYWKETKLWIKQSEIFFSQKPK